MGQGYGAVFVGRHYADSVGVEVYEAEDGEFGEGCVKKTQELAGLDVGVAFCLGWWLAKLE